jgi:hypothetical protein
VEVASAVGFDANRFLRELASQIQLRLNREAIEVAHLKMTFSPEDGLGDIAAISLVRSDFVPELALALPDNVTSGQLILNLRAEGAPVLLKACVEQALTDLGRSDPGLSLRLEHVEHFRPGKPQPSYRDTEVTAQNA